LNCVGGGRCPGDAHLWGGTFFYAVMHKAQVKLEAIESSIEIEIGIEIDSVQFYASV
jgi:hypothetical protein